MRLYSLGIIYLTLSAGLLIGLNLIWSFKSFLLFYKIEILLQSIDQITDKLLRILLPKSRKLSRKVSHAFFKSEWRCNAAVACPNLSNQLSIGTSEISSRPQRIWSIYLIFKVIFHKILCQFSRIAEALQSTIHIASIS